ncbi:uncharacterized protein LOC124271345 [Haliotis rubra]|uniref:uncharacterized protein LOC124271345 n=1 Tax=Haliotis rubra TaxID=36100 RepID=UPI001EE5951E|nr:uncharacterized protein LOC124271345 [Haliotis rubra]
MARKRGHQETGGKHPLKPPDRGRKRQRQDEHSGKSTSSEKLETSIGSRTRSTQNNDKTASDCNPRTRSSIHEKTKSVSSPEAPSSHSTYQNVQKSDTISGLATYSGIQKELLPNSKKSPSDAVTGSNQRTISGIQKELSTKSKESPADTETEANQRAHFENNNEDEKCQESNNAQLTPQKKCRRKSVQMLDEQKPGSVCRQSEVVEHEDKNIKQQKSNISGESDSQSGDTADKYSPTLTPDQGRRFSGRVRKLTKKAAEAKETFKSKFRSKPASPRTQHSKLETQPENAIELSTTPVKHVHSEAANNCGDTGLSEDKDEDESGREADTESGSRSNETSTNVQLSAVQTDSGLSPSGEVGETVLSSTAEPVPGNGEYCPSHHSGTYPSHETDNTISVVLGSANVLSSNHSTGHCSNDLNTDKEIPEIGSSCHGDSGGHGDHLYNARLLKTFQHSVQSTSRPLDHSSVSMVADRGVQASLVKDSCHLVSTGIQVDSSFLSPCQQAILGSDTPDDEDPTANTQQSSPFSTGLPNVNFASLLALPEAGEKVLGRSLCPRQGQLAADTGHATLHHPRPSHHDQRGLLPDC